MEKSGILSAVVLAVYASSMVPVSVFARESQVKTEEFIVLERESELITKKDGGVIRLGDAEITIPAGAVRKDMEISISKLPRTMPLEGGMGNATTGSKGYRFEPKGTKFRKAATIRMGFDPALADNETAISNLYTFFYNTKTERWEALPRVEVDRENCCVVSETTHFTDMINATLSEPESTQAVNLDINSIKNLEAANPLSGYAKVEGFEASPNGSASFSIALDVPGGRNGMKPSVALQYSSDGGSEEAGKGFTLSCAGTVTIDTRWGLPSYTFEGDRENYMFNGERLHYEEAKSTSSVAVFRCESQKRYEKICAILGTSTDGSKFVNYWTVTDRNGRTDVYGNSSTSSNSWTGLSESKKYEWKQCKTSDVYGNSILYSYEKIDGTSYLSSAKYTMYQGKNGPYEVKFNLTNSDRPDTRTSARGKFLSRQSRLYESVEMQYNGNTVWAYNFNYTTNYFGKTILESLEKNRLDRNAKEDAKNFWKFNFLYQDVEYSENGDGIDGFSEAQQFSLPKVNDSYALGTSGSSGGGANITTAVEFFVWVPFVGKVSVASLSATAGYNQTTSRTSSELIDMNGDGIPDMVWQDNLGNIWYRAKDRDGKFLGTNCCMGSVGSALDEAKEQTTSIGVSGNFAMVSAGANFQFSSTSSRGQFMDVDGDGLTDFVVSGQKYYHKNTGGSFVNCNWASVSSGEIESEEFKKNSATYSMIYSMQDLLLAWTPKYDGSVSFENAFRLEEEGTATPRLYRLDGNGNFQELDWKSVAEAEKEDTFYFLASSEGNNERYTVDWNIIPSYTKIRPFSALDQSGYLKPEQTLSSENYNTELESLYELNEDSEEYKLKEDWKFFLTDSNIACLVGEGNFVPPKEIEGTSFRSILECGTAQKSFRIPEYEYLDSDGSLKKSGGTTELCPEWQALISFYKYDGFNDVYIRNEQAPNLFDETGNAFSPEDYIVSKASELGKKDRIRLVKAELPGTGEYHCVENSSSSRYMYSEVFETGLEGIADTLLEGVYVDVSAQDKITTQEDVTNAVYVTEYIDKKALPEKIEKTLFEERFEDSEEMKSAYALDSDEKYYEKTEITDEDTVELLVGIFRESGIQVFGKKRQYLKYSSDTLANVTDSSIIYSVMENGVIRDFSYECGVADLESSYSTEDMRNNSANRFSGISLTEENTVYRSSLQGGKNGWYCGLWTDVYEFSPSLIGAVNTTKLTIKSNQGDTQTVAPAYSYGLSAKEVGGEEILCGETTEETETKLNSQLQNVTEVVTYMAKYKAGHYESERLGGTGWDRLPRTAGGLTGNAPSDIRSSRTNSWDVNGGVTLPFVSANIGYNSGDSWQYQGMMDIDGDSRPDLMTFGDGNDSTSFSYMPGSGNGFTSPKSSSTGMLSAVTQNKFSGVNIGVGKGGSQPEIAPSGKLKQIHLEPAPESSGGISGSVSAGISASVAENRTNSMFADMNGDGLPDQVSRTEQSNFFVALNLGDGKFAEPVSWGGENCYVNIFDNDNLSSSGLSDYLMPKTGGISSSGSGNVGGNLSLGVSTSVVGGGVAGNLSASINQTYGTLSDINGDGLADYVCKGKNDGYFTVWYNTGTGFSSNAVKIYRPDWRAQEFQKAVINQLNEFISGIGVKTGLDDDIINVFRINPQQLVDNNPVSGYINPFAMEDVIDYSTGISVGVSGNLYVSIPVWLVHITIATAGRIQFSWNSSSVKFTDFDGDGLPDHIAQIAGTEFAQVKKNILGKVGLLKGIELPQGGTYSITYADAGNTVDMPGHRYVFDSITYTDGSSRDGYISLNNGIGSYKTRFSYGDGKYSRSEKEFYGFSTVRTINADDSYSESSYSNEEGEYYKKGMLERQDVFTSSGVLVQSSEYVIDSYPYARVTSESLTKYDSSGSGGKMMLQTDYSSFDSYGNILSYTEDSGKSGGKVSVNLTYYNDDSLYLHNHPASIAVYDEEGKLLRLRKGRYTKGSLTSLYRYYGSSSYSATSIAYDKYGNIAKVTDPRGAYLMYEYDSTGQYVKKVYRGGTSYSGGAYESSIDWDVSRGLKTSETDENGNTMTYKYDDMGRLIKVFSPYDDLKGTPAVEYVYHDDQGSFFWTETYNKVSFDADDAERMVTVVQADGMGRTIRTAKYGEKTDKSGNHTAGWNVSGAFRYDLKGRAVEEGQTVFSNAATAEKLVLQVPEMQRATVKEYDDLDRVIKTTLPDGSEQLSSYGIAGGISYVETTDPEGNISRTCSDARGNIVSVIRYDANGTELTRADYEYNVLGEMLCAYDAQKNPITVEYDMLGRRTALESSDSGRREFAYDESGNVIAETNSVLRENNEYIYYTYDGLNRLTYIDYPDSTDTAYWYGEPGAGNNGAGKIVRLTDETGMTVRSYGLLGEVVEESRTIGDYTQIYYNEHNHTWNRWLDSLFGMIGSTYSFLSPWWSWGNSHWHGSYGHHHTWYDESSPDYSGATYSDGAYTSTMSYTSDYLGRMAYITYPDGETISYTYDRGGQVTGVSGTRNGSETVYVADIGYDEYGQRSYIKYGNGVETSYEYDENRRWLSGIDTTDANGRILQGMTYSFDKVGNVASYKNAASNYTTSQSYSYDGLYQLTGAKGTTSYNPDWSYSRDREDPAPYTSTYEQTWRFDNIGNMKSKYSATKDNGLRHGSSDLDYSFQYHYLAGYAHRTERADNMYYTYDANGNITSERRDRASTLAELKRDIEKADDIYTLNYGIALDNQPSVETEEYSRTYIWNERNLLKYSVEGSLVVSYRYGEDGQRAIKSSVEGETLYFNNLWQMSSTVLGWRQSKHIYVGGTRIATKNNWWNDETTEYEQYNTYWYHADHLGSAQLVSDYAGKEYERIEYTPYGELWIEKVRNGFEALPLRFTGKEMDSETGLYYYGARYLDPKYSRWLSTDPALGDYIPGAPINDEVRKQNQNLPGMGGVFNTINASLYHYAGNNPVRYTDPDGRDIIQLLDPERGRPSQRILNNIPFGHAAALIGNDTGGWLYYSNDGPNSTDVQWFSSKKEFFDNYAKDRNKPFNYKEGSAVKTSPEQDTAMQIKAFELAGIDKEKGFDAKETGERFIISENEKPTPYAFLSNNCSQHVGEIAHAGGVYTTGDLIPKLQILMDEKTYLQYQIAKSLILGF